MTYLDIGWTCGGMALDMWRNGTGRVEEWHWTCGGMALDVWRNGTGRVEEWHIPSKTTSKWVHYWSRAWNEEWLSAEHQTVLVTFLGFRKLLYSATPPHVHPMSRYIIARDQFFQAFPRVSTASNKCWGEKGMGIIPKLHSLWSDCTNFFLIQHTLAVGSSDNLIA